MLPNDHLPTGRWFFHSAVTVDGVRYEGFEAATRYGAGDGLCGWNCRHNFHPFFPGMSQRAYTDEELAKLEDGEEYQRRQQQRELERKVRAAKRQYLAEDAAGLDAAGAKAQWQRAERELAAFENEAAARGEFGSNERAFAQWLKSIGAEGSELNTLAKYYQAKYNDSIAYQLLRGYGNAVHKGDISPLISFDLYRQTADEINQRLVGIETSTGVKIASFTTHFIDRTIGQVAEAHPGKRTGVTIESVINTLQSPAQIGPVRHFPNGDIRQTFYGRDADVTISLRDNRLIQANP